LNTSTSKGNSTLEHVHFQGELDMSQDDAGSQHDIEDVLEDEGHGVGMNMNSVGEEEEDEQASFSKLAANEVNTATFDELRLDPALAKDVQTCWMAFINMQASREVAGEMIYAAIFDAAPSLQALFKTPRAVMAMRFMNGIASMIAQLDNPTALKLSVSSLGFQHLDLEVTVPRVVLFRDAIVDLLMAELGNQMSDKTRNAFAGFLNYVGGAYIHVREKFSDRIRIIQSSWATANNKALELDGEMEQKTLEQTTGEIASKEEVVAVKDAGMKGNKGKQENAAARGDRDQPEFNASSLKNNSANVPTTYNEMFGFNAAVMGLASSTWMGEVLQSFDAIVVNVANSYRLQEECDILSLRIAKYKKGSINLSSYKAVMLASLRSLVPKDWNSAHEVAWEWLWENVERMLSSLMGKPAVMQGSLHRFTQGMERACGSN